MCSLGEHSRGYWSEFRISRRSVYLVLMLHEFAEVVENVGDGPSHVTALGGVTLDPHRRTSSDQFILLATDVIDFAYWRELYEGPLGLLARVII